MSRGTGTPGGRISLRDLSIDLAQIVFDITGLVDPTPVSDGANAIISIARGDWFGASISLVSMVPYVGDLAKAGKFPKYLKTVENAIRLASESADAARVLNPIMTRVKKALDLLPDNAGPQLSELRRLVGEYFAKTSAKLPARVLPDIRRNFIFRTYAANGYRYQQASGRLGVPGKVQRFRSRSAQSSVSRGTGDDAGHLIGDRFGAPGTAENLTLQQWQTNRYGTFSQLEDQWAAKLQRGIGIEVDVVDVFKQGESRPFSRKVRWKEIGANGQVTHHDITFMNAHSARSRSQQNIPSTVSGPQRDNVIHVDFSQGSTRGRR
jgi:hypothetical protein